MAFRMVGLCKSKSGAYTARKVIPEDVREEYQRLFGKRSKAGKIGKGHEVRFHAKPSTPHGVAKAQFNDWHAEIETRISTIRASRNGEGQPLTHRQAHALAGDWYRWYVGQREENPGRASSPGDHRQPDGIHEDHHCHWGTVFAFATKRAHL